MSKGCDLLIVSNREAFIKEALRVFSPIVKSGSEGLRSASFIESERVLEARIPRAVLLDLAESSDRVLTFVRDTSSRFSGTRILCAGHPQEVSSVLELVRLGVKDFLKVPFEILEVRAAWEQIERAGSGTPAKSSAGESWGKVITLFSPKGGTGTTFLTVNLAHALSKGGSRQVAVCEFVPQSGDISAHLNMKPQFNFQDIIENSSGMDASYVDGVMTRHSSGIRVLAGPSVGSEFFEGERVLEAIRHVLTLLRDSVDFILIDASHMEQKMLESVLAWSSEVLIVAVPDMMSMRGVTQCFSAWKAHQFDGSKIKVVLNRANSKNRVDDGDFEKSTGLPVTFRLPNDYAICVEAVNSGELISEIKKGSDLEKKIQDIARLISVETKEAAREPVSFFRAPFRLFAPASGPTVAASSERGG